MNKKILLATSIIFLLLTGCGKITSTNTAKQNTQSSSVAATTNSAVAKSPETTTPAATITTIDAIDYNQYIKKTWVVKIVLIMVLMRSLLFIFLKLIMEK